jgi:hypothetical protein
MEGRARKKTYSAGWESWHLSDSQSGHGDGEESRCELHVDGWWLL